LRENMNAEYKKTSSVEYFAYFKRFEIHSFMFKISRVKVIYLTD